MASAYYYRWAAQKTYADVHTDKKSFLIDKTRLSTDWVRPAENLETGQRGVRSQAITKFYDRTFSEIDGL
jgi:hypothetical protein